MKLAGAVSGRPSRRRLPAQGSRSGVVRSFALAAITVAFLLASPASALARAAQQGSGGQILVADVSGAIDPVMARFIARALDKAEKDGARLVVLRIDTPGGYLDSTRDIVTDILASPMPVVSFVAPSGARAASAGTFVAAAAGVAAMAPATNIGAATPVGGAGEDLGETLGRKATEDAAAFIRSIAAQRGRNAEALEETVVAARAYSAEEAVEKNVVDLIAEDLDDLLGQLDGMAIPTSTGDVAFTRAGASVREVRENFVEKALSFLSTPDVAFLLFSLGGLAIIVELWSPGLLGPGVIGVILLLLAFAGLGSMPFSWTGVALIGLALVLFFVETQVPGFGVFGIAGTVALILGGIMLVGFFGAPGLPGGPTIRVSMWTLVGVGGFAGLVVLWFAREVRLSHRAPGYISPLEAQALVGATGTVTVKLGPDGEVRVAGETWAARLSAGETAEPGQVVRVERVDGLTLWVARTESPPEKDARATPDDPRTG